MFSNETYGALNSKVKKIVTGNVSIEKGADGSLILYSQKGTAQEQSIENTV